MIYNERVLILRELLSSCTTSHPDEDSQNYKRPNKRNRFSVSINSENENMIDIEMMQSEVQFVAQIK